MPTLHGPMSQQMSDARPKTGALERIHLSSVLTEFEDNYPVLYAPGAFISKPSTVNNIEIQILSYEMTQGLQPPITFHMEDLDKIDVDQGMIKEITGYDSNTNETIIAYSASDARAWHQLGSERIALFESWTTFSWELPFDRPGFTAALMPIQFTPWVAGAPDRTFQSYHRPKNTAPLRYSTLLELHRSVRQHGADTYDPDSFANIAFQELFEAERATYNMTPEFPSDEILTYFVHLTPIPREI